MTRPFGHDPFCRNAIVMSFATIAAMPMFAQASTESAVDVSVGAGSASNPFLRNAGDRPAVTATLGVSPRFTLTEGRTKFELTGDVRLTRSNRSFANAESAQAAVSGTWMVNPRFTVSPQVGYAVTVAGQTDLTDLTAETPTPLVQDPSVAGAATQRRELSLGLASQYRPDGRQQIGLSLYARDSRLSNVAAGNDYTIVGQTLTYNHQDDRGTFGASLDVMRYRCQSRQFCQQRVISPQATTSIRFNARWTLRASAGASYIWLDVGRGVSFTAQPSADLNLCRADPESQTCLRVAHTVQPTALDGLRAVTTVGVSTNYRLSERNRIVLNGDYSRSAQTSLQGGTFRLYQARLTDEYTLSRSLALLVSASRSDSFSSSVGRRINTEVSFSLRFSLGRRG